MRPPRRPCRRRRALGALALCVVLAGGSGCATVRTLDAAYQRGGNAPLVMSGSRFDAAWLRNPDHARERFGIEPPFVPWADLPFSFLLDVIVLPATVAGAWGW